MIQKELAEDASRSKQDTFGDTVTVAARKILERLLAGYNGPIAVRLWDGERLHGAADAPCTLVFHQPAVLRHLVLQRDLVRLAESYLAGEIDLEGDVVFLFDLVDYLHAMNLPWSTKWWLMRQALRLPAHRAEADSITERRWQSREGRNSAESIAHHYDVSNDFYRLWLDPEMVYSCALFRDAQQPLASAQHDKLDYICRKLRLEPGQSLLDIGCAWGR